MAGQIRIGCSGWQYATWRGRFYPAGAPADLWLSHYARVFDTVEVNNTFYRLPQESTFANWAAATPLEFLWSVKASRYLTHLKRLKDPLAPLKLFFERALALGNQLGPVLYQLPASFRFDLARLQPFLRALPSHARDVGKCGRTAAGEQRLLHVIEFRHESWYRDDVFAELEAHGVALCLHDKLEGRFNGTPVGPFVYLRFHGTSGQYHGSYSRRVLERWARWIAGWAQSGRNVYAYFNNDPDAAAVANATALKKLVGQ